MTFVFSFAPFNFNLLNMLCLKNIPQLFFCLTLRQLNYWQTFLVDILNKGCPVRIKTNRLCSNNHDFNFIQCH